MNEIAKVVASMLAGKSEEEVESVLDGLIQQAEEERKETLERKAEQSKELGAMSLEELEDEIGKAQPGSKKRRELVAAHRYKLNQSAPPSQEQEKIEAREAKRAQLMSELRVLRQGYQTSPEKARRIQEINAELGRLSGGTQAPGKIDITKYLMR